MREYSAVMRDGEFLIWTLTFDANEEARPLAMKDQDVSTVNMLLTFQPIRSPSEVPASLAMVYATSFVFIVRV